MEGRNISVEMPVAVKLNILGKTVVIKRREGITTTAAKKVFSKIKPHR